MKNNNKYDLIDPEERSGPNTSRNEQKDLMERSAEELM